MRALCEVASLVDSPLGNLLDFFVACLNKHFDPAIDLTEHVKGNSIYMSLP